MTKEAKYFTTRIQQKALHKGENTKIYWNLQRNTDVSLSFIDLTKLISVQEVSPAQQDKNNATFLVQCDGRTYQLLAHDEATMRK